MRNFYVTASAFVKALALFFCLFFISKSDVKGQSVNITVNITPPYSPFYSDYAGPNANKVFLTVQNLTNTTKNIKLTGQLEGDNGIRLTTKSNYVPLQPIVLAPNQVRQLNGLALKDIFDVNSLNVYGIDKVKLVQTSRLPEGNYTFCVQAVDLSNNQVISSATPLGCTSIRIAYPDAPILISPLHLTSLNATKPQSVVFNWINAGFVPIGTQYILQLAEMPTSSTNPDQVLNGVSFPLINKTLNRLSYILSPTDPPLIIGKKYAWRVKALDPSGKIIFKNNGISKASIFSYNNPIINLNAPNITSPLANAEFLQKGNVSVEASQPVIDIAWNTSLAPPNAKIKYRLKIVKIKEGMTVSALLKSSAGLAVNEEVASTAIKLKPLDIAAISTLAGNKKSVVDGSVPSVKAQLEPGASYAIQVVASGTDESGQTMNFSNLGESNTVIFKYTAAAVAVPPVNNNSTIAGRFVYRYKNDGEKPTSSLINFPSKYIFKKIGGISRMLLNDAPFPDVTANEMFANNTETRPLKNAKIKLVYMRFESDIEDPTKYTDLKPYDEEKQPSTYQQYAKKYKEDEQPGKVVGTGTTDENGQFSITFLNDMKIGLISELQSGTYYNKAFGAICISIDEDEYSSSDMMIFPKNGKTIYLPDEVIFPRSFRVEMTVKTDKTTDQALISSAPVAGYPVQLSVVQSEYPTKPSYPVEAGIVTFKDMDVILLGKKAMVLGLDKTDAEGKILFKNLILADNKYAQALEQKFEGNFAYETQTFNIKRDVCNSCPQTYANYRLSKRNSVFEEVFFKRNLIITPKKPQIYLRVMTLQNGIPSPLANATVTIQEYATAKTVFPDIKKILTDKNGYFELRDLEIKTELQGKERKVIGPLRSITISKTGYNIKTVANKQLLAFGERFPAQVEQFLSAAGIVAGHVVNEEGYPVIANIRVADGPFVKTDDKGYFVYANVATGSNTQIEVVPVVDNYFPETWKTNVLQGGKTMLSNIGVSDGRIVVREKLHRFKVKIVNQNNAPVADVKVSIGNNPGVSYFTNNEGLTKEIKIASPDYEFRIRTEAGGYVNYDNYHRIDIDKVFKPVPITLIPAKTIVGYVLDKSTKKPIANARVYTISGTNEDGQIQNETRTNASGYYVLNGAINQSTFFDYQSGLNIQKPIEVYAVKGGEMAYIRQSQTVVFAVGQGASTVSFADFALSPLGVKAEIWGMPVEINAAEDVKNASMMMKISGAFVNIPGNAAFKPTVDNAQLPFRDLLVNVTGNLGSFALNPTSPEVVVQKNTFKVTAFNKFSAEVLGSDQFFNFSLLKISKNSKGLGVLNGFVSSELSSFNFSYNYNGKFLFDKSGVRIPGKPVTYNLDVLGAPNSITPAVKFNLKALYGVSNFKVHNFNATMANGSFVDTEKFVINALVNLDIPLVSTKTLPVGSIHVTQNNIAWNDYQGDIALPLEKWLIKGKGLKYELNKGGFQIVDGTLQTDLPHIPLKNMILMPSTIDLGANTLTGKESLSLGNVTPLNLVGDAKLTLNYDAAAPFDQKPHYRVNLSGNGKKVAYIANIPGIAQGDKIEIELFTAYSDAIHKTVNITPSVHRFFDVISQTTAGIEVGSDYFTLIGNTNLEIPGANNNVTGRFRYYKDHLGNIVQTTEKLQTDLEMPGKVKFNGTSFKLSPGLFTATGNVLIYKNTIADAIPIIGTITKTTSETKMDILANEKIKMGTAGRSMRILNGGSSVDNAKWNLVTFTASPDGFVIGGKEILEKDKDQIDFIVNGALANNPASKKVIQLQGVESPFGKFDISFDFEKRALMGALTISGANIPLGPVNIHDGKIDMQIDGNGFILAGGITNASLTPLPILKGFKSGIALGFYGGKLPDYMTQNLLSVTLYNELPGLEDGLKGFYVNVMKSLSKEDLPKLPGPSLENIPVVGSFVPVLDFFAGVDLRTSINLNKGLAIKLGGKAEAYASFLSKVGPCDIGISGRADGEFALEYVKPDLTGFLKFGIGANLIYCVGQKGLGMTLLLEKGTSGFKFTPSLN